MSIALVTSHSEALGANGGTTAAVDTTGADLLVLVVAQWTGPTTPTDSKSNTWTGLTTQANGNIKNRIWYAVNPTVGSGHTFTVSGTTIYSAVMLLAFSGADTTTPFDVENGATASAVTAVNTGSVTPAENGEVLVAGLEVNGVISALGIDLSFTLQEEVAFSLGNNMGGAAAYKVQGTAAAQNPQWSWTTSRDVAVTIATFKAAAAGGAAGPFPHFTRRRLTGGMVTC